MDDWGPYVSISGDCRLKRGVLVVHEPRETCTEQNRTVTGIVVIHKVTPCYRGMYERVTAYTLCVCTKRVLRRGYSTIITVFDRKPVRSTRTARDFRKWTVSDGGYFNWLSNDLSILSSSTIVGRNAAAAACLSAVFVSESSVERHSGKLIFEADIIITIHIHTRHTCTIRNVCAHSLLLSPAHTSARGSHKKPHYHRPAIKTIYYWILINNPIFHS